MLKITTKVLMHYNIEHFLNCKTAEFLFTFLYTSIYYGVQNCFSISRIEL